MGTEPRQRSGAALALSIVAGTVCGILVVLLTNPQLRGLAATLLRIAWLYVLTGARS